MGVYLEKDRPGIELEFPLKLFFFPGRVIPETYKLVLDWCILPGTWRNRVSTLTGWPGVSMLCLVETSGLICSFCLSVAARTTVPEINWHVAGRSTNKHHHQYRLQIVPSLRCVVLAAIVYISHKSSHSLPSKSCYICPSPVRRNEDVQQDVHTCVFYLTVNKEERGREEEGDRKREQHWPNPNGCFCLG